MTVGRSHVDPYVVVCVCTELLLNMLYRSLKIEHRESPRKVCAEKFFSTRRSTSVVLSLRCVSLCEAFTATDAKLSRAVNAGPKFAPDWSRMSGMKRTPQPASMVP